MEFSLIRQAMQLMIDNGIKVNEAQQVIDDIDYMKKQIGIDSWDDCHILAESDVMNLLNRTTYDVYGRLYAANNGKVTFEQYAYKCRTYHEWNCTSDTTLKVGYEFISDLYSDNEEKGFHNPDGTFNHDYSFEIF